MHFSNMERPTNMDIASCEYASSLGYLILQTSNVQNLHCWSPSLSEDLTAAAPCKAHSIPEPIPRLIHKSGERNLISHSRV